MKLSFFGADQCVTGSCHCLEVNGKHILIDCGLQQGRDEVDNATLPFHPGSIDAVLVTHAHIDHSGRIPMLIKNGFQGKIITTRLTANLLNIMLADSAHIQESDAEYQNRKNQRAGRPNVEPLYTVADAMRVPEFLQTCEYHQTVDVCEGVKATFIDAGHLLGSASILMELTEGGEKRNIVFSGDIGNVDQPIIRDPQFFGGADYVVMESTYGNRNHTEVWSYTDELAEIIDETLGKGGNVVIPSFAVGRTQEMLYYIREIREKKLVTGHDGFPVYVDSPMANEATAIYLQCGHECFDEETRALVDAGINPIWSDGIRISVSSEDSKAINENPEPKVILSASGMCEAGRIRHHLKHNLWRKESTVLFVGYQAEGTLGRRLYDGEKHVKLFGEDIEVNCEIGFLPGKSGHADRDGLTAWLAGFEKKPKLVFVNHGEDAVTDAFAGYLETEHGYKAFAPYSGTVFDLAEGKFLVCPKGVPVKKAETASGAKASGLYQKLVAAGESLLSLIRASRGKPNKTLKHFLSDVEELLKKYR